MKSKVLGSRRYIRSVCICGHSELQHEIPRIINGKPDEMPCQICPCKDYKERRSQKVSKVR